MAQYISLRKQTMFLIKNRTQQVIGVDYSFHQHIGMSFSDQCHSFLSSFVGTCRLIHFYMLRVLQPDIFGIQ